MRKNFSYQGNPIHYTLSGKGEKIMLVHGFGETASIWDEVAEALAVDYEVLVPDIPGSASSPQLQQVSMESLANAFKALADSLNWKKFTLIGHSMGGYIAVAFAELFPTTLNGLGFFHSTAFADSEEKITARKKGIQFIKDNGASAFIRSTTPNLFAPENKETHPELIEMIIKLGALFNEQSLIAYYQAMMQRPDRSELLTSLDYPVLIIMGKHDQAVPMKDTLRLCKLPKIAYIHTLFNSGHMGMLEETEKSIYILKRFMADISQ